MKKQALTILLILLMIKTVSACSYPAEYIYSEHESFAERHVEFLLIGSVFFSAVVTISYFLRNRKYSVYIYAALVSYLLSVPAFFILVLYDICGNSAYDIFLYQFVFTGILGILNLIFVIGDLFYRRRALR